MEWRVSFEKKVSCFWDGHDDFDTLRFCLFDSISKGLRWMFTTDLLTHRWPHPLRWRRWSPEIWTRIAAPSWWRISGPLGRTAAWMGDSWVVKCSRKKKPINRSLRKHHQVGFRCCRKALKAEGCVPLVLLGTIYARFRVPKIFFLWSSFHVEISFNIVLALWCLDFCKQAMFHYNPTRIFPPKGEEKLSNHGS